MSDPFQLQVKVRSGPHANIMDIGYGVSQSLPILIDVMTAADSNSGGRSRRRPTGRLFLLQQPEVHLHPRGQAQLANLFIEAHKRNGSRFLIETHSDYIVDRVRISVRKRSADQGGLRSALTAWLIRRRRTESGSHSRVAQLGDPHCAGYCTAVGAAATGRASRPRSTMLLRNAGRSDSRRSAG